MVYILLGRGFEECEVTAPCTVLRRGGVQVRLAGIGGMCIEGARGMRLMADCTAEEIEEAEMIVLPGGLGGVQEIERCTAALDAVRRTYEKGGCVAAICAAPTVLAKIGLLEGKRATVYPGMEEELRGAQFVSAPVVTDGRILTARAAGAAFDFGLALLRFLRGDAIAGQVRESIVYEGGLR